jgi:putative heme-binding domain-containing protein
LRARQRAEYRDLPLAMNMKLKLLVMLCAALPVGAQTPEWIWFDNKGTAPESEEVRFFRKTFQVPAAVSKAVLTTSGDDRVTAYFNGEQVGQNRSWDKAVSVDLTKQIKIGENVLALRGRNNNGSAAVIAKLEFTLKDGTKKSVVTDASWSSAATEADGWQTIAFKADDWAKPVSRGKLGVQPWGDVMATPVATAADKLTVLPGFKVELLRSAERGEGSWVCMATDPKGRLIVSPQDGTGNMLRITLNKAGQIEKMEKIDVPVGAAMGLLYAFDSLYVGGNGPEKLGLYRIKDTDGDDQYDKVEFLRKFDGAGGEHGSHALVLGPDNKIYYIHGNFVKVPADISPNSPHRNYTEDVLLPRQEDGNGFGVGIKPPGSFVLRMDKDAKEIELFAAGMRNAYDIDFNADGEMFTFDSDMEWDWGTPWYRATRIYHVVSGGDYGFREGTAKYPAYYPDALPPTVDIGIGSPTGVKFGTKSSFPTKYKRAFFAMDWSYGRIVAVHLQPQGATYAASFEPFIVGKPLNVTDLEFGRDGAMYFTTGGRGTQSGLYRVTYTGKELPEPVLVDKEAPAARAIRHKLEAFHGKQNREGLEMALKNLDNKDRWIRYAARIALESQPVAQWQEQALNQKTKHGSLTALLALARLGPSSVQDDLLKALGEYWPDGLDDEQKLEVVRVCSLALIRMGRPDEETTKEGIEALAPLYPSSNPQLNRELAQLLIYLQAPGVVQKTLDLLSRSETQEEQIHYIFHLRNVKSGWMPEDREKYFAWFKRDRMQDKRSPELAKWFADVGRDQTDGSSFPKFMANIKKDAVATLSDAEKTQLASLIATDAPAQRPTTERKFVKEWTMADIVPSLAEAASGRNFRRGREAFTTTQCILCHKFGTEGGSVGPDITGAASRFNRRDLLETIIEPSKVISDQYQNITITKKDGDEVTGRLVEENDDRLVLLVNPLTTDRTELKKRDVAKRTPSRLSPMPEGLVNILTKEEILDLLAYIEAGGKREHAAFAR